MRLLSDPTGQVLASMRYSPFGELEAQSGPPSVFGFTGEQRFYRVLIVGGMGLGLGALGLVAGAGFVAAGVPGLAAAGLATAITVVVGVGNEAYIKPRIFRGLGLQQE